MSHLFAIDADQVATTTDDWYTPRWVFDAAGIRFDVDVAAPVDPEMRTCPADEYLTIVGHGEAPSSSRTSPAHHSTTR